MNKEKEKTESVESLNREKVKTDFISLYLSNPIDKKSSRIAYAIRLILDKKTVSPIELNKVFISNGGKDNISESKYAIRTALIALRELRLVTVEKTVTIS